MTWDAYNRRKEALREVLAVADSRRDTTAHQLIADNDSARDAFGSASELMLDVQMNWYQRLSGQLDRALTDGADDLEELVIRAWSDAAAQAPGARVLIDASEYMPELQRALANEAVLLARTAGIRSSERDQADAGAGLRSMAKAAVVDIPEIPDTPAGLFTRIRSALAA